ncbi:MAG: hypothetical protein KGP12_12845 [Actinomycetales bacterium]|nr:hypothetical protein [Actinomycetales bacterium]
MSTISGTRIRRITMKNAADAGELAQSAGCDRAGTEVPGTAGPEVDMTAIVG